MWYYSDVFGYIAPLKSELKMREFEIYNAYYCAICHAVKRRYGEPPRLLLSYDAVFLAMLAESICSSADDMAFSSFRCFNNPLKKRIEAARSEAIEYAADVMVLLGWLSLKDGRDDKDAGSFIRRIATGTSEVLLRRAGRKASRRLGEKGDKCLGFVKDQKALEARKEISIDRAADPTAQMMSELLRFPSSFFEFLDSAAEGIAEELIQILSEIGYHLGRYIFIIDAIDDLEKDKKSGSYNPLLLAPKNSDALETAVLLDLAKVCELTNKLCLQEHKSIIDNIVYLGLRSKLDEVLSGAGEYK